HNWQLGNFSREFQEEIFGKQPYVLAPGSVNPNDGIATPKGDGYELTGHWRFGTGIVHADWVLLSGRIATDPEGMPRMFIVRPVRVEAGDPGHVEGWAAPGSPAIAANGAPAPERQVTVRPRAGDAASQEYLRRIPVFPFLGLPAAIPSVGAARRAVELFR